VDGLVAGGGGGGGDLFIFNDTIGTGGLITFFHVHINQTNLDHDHHIKPNKLKSSY
jgi:hypothetical protein